jgi:hypothetical protein
MSNGLINGMAGGAPAPQNQDYAPEKAGAAAPDTVELRLARIREYLTESLQQPDALRANLGAASSDLMLLGFRLKEAIEEGLGDPTNALGRIERLMPAIEGYLKVTRQMDRFAHLDRLLRDNPPSGSPQKPR